MRTVALSVFLLLVCLVTSFAQKDLQLIPLADDARQQTSAPRIEIIYPINSHDLPPNQALSYVSTSRNLRIAGLVADDQGIAEVTVNGQPVKLMPPGGKDLLLVQLEGQTVGFEAEIPLSDSNTILITARDTQGNLSERKLEVEYRTRDGLQQATGQRWALIIGVEDYQDPQITDLRYSIDDARALYEVLVDPKRGGFETDHVKLLTDDATDSKLLPTRLNILDALNNWLRQTTERDTVIFYFSVTVLPTSLVATTW